MITTLIVIPLTTLQFIIIVGILAPVVCMEHGETTNQKRRQGE